MRSPRHLLRRSLTAIVWLATALPLVAQSHQIAAAPAGLLEAGAPQFIVLNKESLGLDAPPTDLHLLPDGRVLVVAGPQFALGDGVRWDVFNQAPSESPTRALSVAVDADGSLYEAIPGGFARVEFGDDGRWRLRKVADWPADDSADRPVPRDVIVAGTDWLWHGGSGSVIAWRPGQTARSLGTADTVATIFAFRGRDYLSDWSLGTLSEFKGAGQRPAVVLPDANITSAERYNDDLMLVGTSQQGLQLFDGQRLRPLPDSDPATRTLRVNSLCAVPGGYFAAAVENRGIVFLDAHGRTVQVLDRTLDHRLSRVVRILPGANGIVWGLLPNGVLRVEFPSRVSHFEPLIHSGLVTIHPNRADGHLWLIASSQLLRANYDADGRLTEFVTDTPENQKAFTFSSAPGLPIAGTETGGYYRDATGWHLFAPQAPSFRVLQNRAVDGEWLYSAENEVGWMRRTAAGFELRRYPQPGIGRVFNSVTDASGDTWLELGTGKLGRVRAARPGDGAPVVELLGPDAGVPAGWGQVFVLDGTVRFNISDRILRFDAGRHRLEPDEDFARAFAGLGTIVGRPGRDASGRLWITTEQGVNIFEGPLNQLRRVDEPMPAGFQPYYFTFESSGVVWMHATRRLARYDPAIATPERQPLQALITHITLPASRRTLYPADGRFPALPYADNTLVAHFLTSGAPFTSAITFDVNLTGGEQGWVSAGSAGSAVFNQLKEGRYELQVRPRAARQIGVPTKVAIVIQPPWYRTGTAYAAATLLLLAGAVVVSRVTNYLQRRKQRKLEGLVRQRTAELRETNLRLAAQVEENRTLSQAIQESPVGVLILKPDGTIVFANARVCESSGYTFADLHGQPVGKLRGPGAESSPAIAFEQARQRGESWRGQMVNRTKDEREINVRITASPLRNQRGHTALYLVLVEDITEALQEQERRRRLESQLFQAQKRESLGTLAGGIAHDFNNILTGILGYCELARLTLGEQSPVAQELAAITAAGRRAKDLVSQILSFTRQTTAQLTSLNLAVTVAEALKLVRASMPPSIELVQSLAPGHVRADATQIHQVMLNLCTNAIHAMRQRPGRLEVLLEPVTLDEDEAHEFGVPPGEYMRTRVADTGTGMAPEVLDRIFDPFFTTKDPGEGTGLGLSIVHSIVSGHQGGLRVRSTVGAGTTFDIVLPVSHEAKPDSNPPIPTPAGGLQEVLIVDDEPMVTDFLSARLQQLAYRPMVLHDPRAALELLTAESGRFAALITDLSMPHMSGVELIGKLRERGVFLPTLIITGYNRNSARADLASVPDIPLLQKPFTGDELAQALHRVIESGRHSRAPFKG